MTLQDIITFLHDESECQTLTEKDITRCVLLAFDLGMAAGERRMRDRQLHAAPGIDTENEHAP